MIAGHVYVVRTTLTNPPKDKIVLCICGEENLFFWFNSKAAFSGIGQIKMVAADHPGALTHNCFLDCSRVTTFGQQELATAQDRGAIAGLLAERIVAALAASPPRSVPKRFLDKAANNLGAMA